MIASLAMYDFGDVQAVNDQYWRLIGDNLRAAGLDAPDALTRGNDAYWPAWQSPDLLLSQTCGYPFRARLSDQVAYVATPDFGVKGCPPGYYRSAFVARRRDARTDLSAFDGAPFAFNEDLSQSGWAGPMAHAARIGLRLDPVLRSGSHRASALAVAAGLVDIAGIDAVTFRNLERNFPNHVAELRIVGWTDPTPGLPYITAKGMDVAVLRHAVAAVLTGLSQGERDILGVKAFVDIPAQDYLRVPNPPTPAQFGLAA